MIKKQHFVALVTSFALVLSGCETTDLATEGISASQEENTIIELVGPNGKSGTIKLPTSNVKKTEEDSETESKDEENQTESTESEEKTSDDTKTNESQDVENPSEDVNDNDEKTEETKEDEKAEDKTDEKKDETAEKSDEKTEDTKEEGKTDTAPADEKTEEGSEKTEEKEEVPEKDFSANNKVLMQKVEAARLAAIDAGARSVSPTTWAATEGIYNAEKSLVDAGSKQDLSSVLNDLIARYQGHENLAQAKDLKDEIDENNFAPYRQATYNAGAQILSDLTNPLSVIQSGSDFNQQAATAESDFRLVLRTAYNNLAQNERTAAYEAKLKADSVKAYVSRKDDYTKAVTLYRNGELRRSVDPKLANESYRMSKEQFMTLFVEISAARAQAQKEIDEAKKSVQQSATVAERADVEAPLGNEPVEGIEAEDAKLLEDDDFSNAGEAAVIEAPEAD